MLSTALVFMGKGRKGTTGLFWLVWQLSDKERSMLVFQCLMGSVITKPRIAD